MQGIETQRRRIDEVCNVCFTPLEGQGKIFEWYNAKGDLFASPPVSKHNAQSFNFPYRFGTNIYIMKGEGKRGR